MKRKIIGVILVIMLLFPALPTASAHIDIVDIGIGYDGVDHYGYIDYRNVENYNVSGALLVFINGDIVAGKILNMPICYVAGFRCSPVKTLEFPLRTTKGDHAIVAYAVSMNRTIEGMFNYTMEGWEEEEDEEEIKGLEIEDWLKCSICDGRE